MPKRAVVRFQPLQTCLVNLPLSIHGQLVAKAIRPQSLVVCLTWTSKDAQNHTAYVGWTGMPARTLGPPTAAASKNNIEAVELDPVAARELGIQEGVEVSIDLLRNLPAAKTVQVEPVTADDWEIVELHAEYVEQNLLSQVRAASPNQTLCVWVGKARTLVRFRIDSVEPADDIAVRLTIDTEVIVAPKTRYTASQALAKERHNIGSSNGAGPSAAAKASLPADVECAKRRLLRLLPADVDVLELLQKKDEEDGTSEAWVSPRLFRLLLQAYPSTKVSLAIKDCPACKRSKPQAEESSTSLDIAAKGKGKSVASENTDTNEDGSASTVNVHLQSDANVPEGCIWLSPSGRAKLGSEGSGDFPLIRLSKPKKDVKEAIQETKQNGTLSEAESSARLPVLAGVQKHLDRCLAHIRNTLFASQGLSVVRTQRPTLGILLCGASGAGKTSLVERIASLAKRNVNTLCHIERVSCTQLVNLRTPQIQAKLDEVFTLALWHAPSLVILDDLDRLLPAEVEHIDSFHAQHLSHLFLNTANKAIKERPVVVLATAKGPETLHACLSQSHFFGERITLRAPDKTARREIFESLIQEKLASGSGLALSPDLNFVAAATQTEGYLPVDLQDLLTRSLHQASIRSNRLSLSTLELTSQDIVKAQEDFTPLSLRDVKLQKSDVRWEDIGGLSETKRVLRETLEWPTKYAAIFAASPLRLRSGLLLYGFPGCGKTLLASAVAKECGLNFISVKGPEILNKYIGASEKSVRDLFERASSAKPCVLFFDEFDSIAPKRGHDSTGVTDRVVNQMLTQMDGAEGLDGVYVLAATSRPDLIDPALLRPGRLDRSLLCEMPSAQDRLDIMRACARKVALSDDIDLAEYVKATEGYSGADLQAVIYNANLEAIHATISANKTEKESSGDLTESQQEKSVRFVSFGGKEGADRTVKSKAERAKMEKRIEQMMASLNPSVPDPAAITANVNGKPVTRVQAHHLENSLRTTRPSLPRDEVRRLQRIYNEFVSDRAKGGLPNGQPSDEIGGRSSLM